MWAEILTHSHIGNLAKNELNIKTSKTPDLLKKCKSSMQFNIIDSLYFYFLLLKDWHPQVINALVKPETGFLIPKLFASKPSDAK